MAVRQVSQQREGDGAAGRSAAAGNRVKSRPAKDATINGILSQLGSLDTPMNGNAARHTSFTKPDFSDFDQGSRPQSPVHSLASAPIVPFSPSNAVHTTAGAADNDDEVFDDVATPPTVPINRSLVPQHTIPRRLSYGEHGQGAASSSRHAQATDSSWTSRAGENSPELQQRQIRSVESQDTASSSRQSQSRDTSSPEAQKRQIRRIESQDTLRQVQPDRDFQPDQDFIFDGLGSMATFSPAQGHSPKMLGKARMYMQENFDPLQDISSADLAVKATDAMSIASDHSRGSSAGPSTPRVRKLRAAPRASPISDSIPLRTSSLRSAQSPASSKRRTRVRTTPRTGSLYRTISEDKPDEPWADLGEDDETVKRIKELRRKRESRLTSASINNSSIVPTKAEGLTTPSGNGASGNESTGRLQLRPITPHTRDRPLSLDYSYSQAIDALQSASNNSSPQRGGMSAVQPIGFKHRRTASNTSANTTSSRIKKQRGKFIAATVYDADEKGRNRRKSMSDARRPGDDLADAQRRDSVETAVLDYLHDPRLSQYVLDPQTQRKISFSEVGDPRGAAVMVCVGMGLTRFVTAFFDELATTLRLRLITIERPGVGESAPYPPNDKSGPLMWAADVTAVTDYLGISSFSMLAHSAGAVYALGTALTLPHYVRGSIHLLAPWIPPSQLQAAPYATDNAIPAGALPRSQRILRVLPAPLLRMANNSNVFSSLKPDKRSSDSPPNRANGHRTSSESPNRRRPQRPTTSSGARPENPRRESLMLMDQFMPDTNPMENFPLATRDDEKSGPERKHSAVFLGATINPNDPSFTLAGEALNAAEHSAREKKHEFARRLTQLTWEYAIKDSNPATDLMVCLERNREIGFRYTDIVRRVIITHGSEDKRVPVGNVKWLADQMNRAVVSRYAMSRDTLSFDPGAEPGCELRVLETEGHGLMASPVIMADVLTEIAGYWTAEERGRRPSQNL